MGCVTVPLITHEIGQYSVYPDLKEIDSYTGTLDPLNFKAVRADLQQKGLLDRAEDYLMASGRLASILYKEEIERDLKTNGISGYQLLGLQDFPGQGTALVGLVNAFWQSKHVVDPSWFRQFCAPVVPLANFAKAVYRSDEPFDTDIQLVNYVGKPLEGYTMLWSLRDASDAVLKQGELSLNNIPNGGVFSIANLQIDLSEVSSASQLTFRLAIADTEWSNEWPIWVYPALAPVVDESLLVTSNLSQAMGALQQGKTVVLSPALGSLKGLEGKFLPVFWSPVHFPKQAGTMGILCNPEHPALAQFPTDSFGNWQWWRLAKRSTVLNIDSLQLSPIVESVDNFMHNRRLATVFEAKVGSGKLLFSAIDLLSEGAESPEVQQFLHSLCVYAASAHFNPQCSLTPEQLQALFLNDKSVQRTKATSIYE